MTRRNKVRQAVSWWKAIKTEEWHRNKGEDPCAEDIEGEYLFEAIDHLLIEASIRECAIQEFLDAGRIIPFTIAYEDFVTDYENTVMQIIDFLEIPYDGSPQISPPFFEKLADEISEIWVQRYRQEKQKEWKNYW
jgi:trehalose 2-sulfotransferase